MVSISAALDQIKLTLSSGICMKLAEPLCQEMGLEYRNTILTPPKTIVYLAKQVLMGNVSGPELCRNAGGIFTPSGWCEARKRLPLELLPELNRRICLTAGHALDQDPQMLWHGHRLWHVDGSSFSMPDTPALQRHFGQPGNQAMGCGFPVAHILCLFGAKTGLVRDIVVSPMRTGDIAKTPTLHRVIQPNDIAIGDKAFCTYFELAMLQSEGKHGVFPCHQTRIVNFTPHRPYNQPTQSKNRTKGLPQSRWVKSLGHDDQAVEYFKPPHCPPWMTPQQYEAAPPSILVRELRRKVRLSHGRKKTVVIVTTLLDAQIYPPEELVEVTRQRWGVEVNLRHLKTTMGMEVLRSKSVEGVTKELWMYAIIYNLTRLIMIEASRQQNVKVDRVSFADALYWLRHRKANTRLVRLLVNPDRYGRVEPRAIKRRPKEYDRLNKPRWLMRKALILKAKNAI